MKRTLARMGRRLLSVLLAFCLMFSLVGTAFAAEATNEKTEINYVSIGDSMANGYCFEGYEQGNGDKIDFFEGKGVYGEGAYPLQFEKWLTEQGKTVHHTKLAPSAMRAEDLNYLLGGREEPNDDWQNQVNGYTEVYDDVALSAFYQKAVTEADIITLGIGNASFGAYMLHRVTDALGVFGAELDEDEQVDLEDALIGLDEEQKQVVLEAYNEMKTELLNYIPAELAEQYNVEQICGIMAYTAAGFLLNYEGSLDQIVKLNDDVEVILVGLMNTTYGMTVTAEGMDPIPVGDIMDNVFAVLNAYVAGLPAVKQAAGEWTNATFYYAEQPNPLFISQEFDALKEANWANIQDDRLSGSIVRDRNISAYNGSLREMIGAAFSVTLPKINLAEVQAFEANPPAWANSGYGYGFTGQGADAKNLSVAIYLGIEDAVAASTDTMEIPLEGLMTIAGDIGSVFKNLELDVTKPENTPEKAREILGNYLTSTDTLKGMCKIYALFKVGNGMSVHPTPEGHDNIAAAVIEAYETNHTAADQTKENLIVVAETAAALIAEYYDDAYAYAYAEAKDAGYIDAAVAEIEAVKSALANIDLSGTEMTDVFKAEVAGEIAEIIETLTAAQALIVEADVLDQASLDALIATLNQAGEAIVNLENLLVQAGVDVNELAIIPALKVAHAKLVDEVIPAVKAQLQQAVQAGTEWLMNKLQDAYDALVEAAVEAAPEVADWVYDWLYNNPDKVIAFFNEYGDDMVAFLDEFKEEIAAVLGYVLVNYGEDMAELVMDNADVILKTLVEWVDVHGENAWALICVYLDELGVCDAVNGGIQAALDKLTALLAKVDSALAEQVETAIDALGEAAEKLLAEAEAVRAEIEKQIAELNGKLDELEQDLAEKKAELENASEELKAEIEAAIAELEAQIAELNGKLDELERDLAEKKAELENASEELKAEIEAAIAELEAQIAKVEAAIAELEALLKSLNDEVEALYEAILGLNDAVEIMIEEGLNAGMVAIQAALDEVAEAVIALGEAVSEEATAAMTDALNKVKDLLNEIYIDATTDHYVITENSYYVALGDADAYGKSADLLTKELGLCNDHANLTVEGQTADALLAELEGYAADIARADLVTLGFSANAFTNFALDQLSSLTPAEMDWSIYLGEEGAAKIEAKLAEMHASFVATGVGDTYAGIMSLAIESYAYAYMQHVAAYAQVVEAIHAINPDAQVVLVGMYNPMDGVVVVMGEEKVDLGEYMRYLVDLSNAYALGYAMIVPETIYVDAPDVATNAGAMEVDVAKFVMNLMRGTDAYEPTEAGYEYIKGKILNALNPTFVASGLLGDADNDGDVDNVDAMLILQYHTGVIADGQLNLCWCDVDADGDVDNVDAMLVLQYHTGVITEF